MRAITPLCFLMLTKYIDKSLTALSATGPHAFGAKRMLALGSVRIEAALVGKQRAKFVCHRRADLTILSTLSSNEISALNTIFFFATHYCLSSTARQSKVGKRFVLTF